MSKRQEEEESEWMSRKKDILSLYVEQDKPLSDVMHAMARQGFIRTKPQYERSFKRWRVSKNVRKEEWDFILGRLNERNRPTDVKVRGVVISQGRIERQKLRKRETTFDLAKSRLQPQSRSRTPPSIEISTPRPTAEHNHRELSEVSDHDEHLDEEVLTADSRQGPILHARDDDHVLSSAVTAPDVAAASNASDHIPANTPFEEIRSPSPSSHSILNSTQLSCSELLYEYMRAAIFVGDEELSSTIPIAERHDLRHLHIKPVEELLRDGYNNFLQSFIKHTLPKDDLYDVVRVFDNVNDMMFLKRLLLIANSDTNWIWNGFCTNLLLYAADDGNERLLVILLDIGVNIHARALGILPHQNNLNAIQIAILSGNRNIIEILDSRGAEIFTGDQFQDITFLSDASTRGTLDFAKPLLTKAATLDTRTTRHGIQVLIQAVECSRDSIVSVLLETGFSPFSNLFEGSLTLRESAFTVALRRNKTRYPEKFLEVPCHNFDGEQCKDRLRQLTAGYVSACCFEHSGLKKAILDAGWNPDEVKLVLGYDYVQEYLYDALTLAVKSGDCNRVRCLTQIGASPNCPSDMIAPPNLPTPLEWAMGQGKISMVRQLIAAGADVNFLSSGVYESPLQYAVSRWNLVVVRLLVDAGANVNYHPRRWSRSAIEIAAGGGQIEMVTYLLDSGADIQGRHNRNYRRTLYRAKMAGHDSVVDLLQEWKRSRFGDQDCDTIDNIMETMTIDELDFPSEEARIDYLERGQSDTESTLDYTTNGTSLQLFHSANLPLNVHYQDVFPAEDRPGSIAKDRRRPEIPTNLDPVPHTNATSLLAIAHQPSASPTPS